GGMMDLSIGLLNLLNIGDSGTEPAVSWGSEIGSVASSVSGLSDIENMENMVTEETSYVNSVASEHGENEDKTTPRKTHTQTYVLGHLPKVPIFDNMNDDDDILMLSSPEFASSVPLIKSHAADTCSFKPVKSFTLNIELSAVPEKTNSDKLIAFSGIIRLSFTSELSLKKAREMAISEKIFVNNNVRKVNSHSDQEVIVKKILIDLLRSVIETVFSKFGRIVAIKLQLIGLWQKALIKYESSKMADLVAAQWSVLVEKNSVCVAKAINDKQMWVSRDQHKALPYTLPTEITAHDLSGLLELYGEKTCFIGQNPSSYVHNRCAIICFGDEASKLAAIGSVLVFKGANLHWAGLFLACCTACKQFGHVSGVCPVVISDQDQVHLAGIYKKKQAPISYSMSFAVAGDSLSRVSSSGSSSAGACSGLVPSPLISDSLVMSQLDIHLATLEHSLEILADQISGILKKLSFVDLVLLASLSDGAFPVVSVPVASVVGLDMALDKGSILSVFPFSGAGESAAVFSSSGSRVFTSKVGGLESKMSALKASIGAVLARLDLFCLVWKFAMCNVQGINVFVKQADVIHWHMDSGNMDKFDGVQIFSLELDKSFMGTGIAIIINTFLAHHVSKIEEVPSRVISVWLLFKGKLLVTVLGLYAGASFGAKFGQTSEVNSLIAKAVNSSNFVILGGDFNENGSDKSASFKFCLSLGLVNSFVSHHLVDSHTWSNSRGVGKMINYIFVGDNLSFAVAGHQVVSVSDFFDTDHRAVVVLVGLSGLLDVQLNSLHKQANRDCWKFKIKDVDCTEWAKFKDLSLTKLLSLGEAFSGAEMCGDVDAMWAVLVGAVVDSADATFSRHWFSKFKCSRNVHSSRFFGLEMLVAKIVKKFCSSDLSDTNCLVSKWLTLDVVKACAFKDLVDSRVKSNVVVRHLSLVRRDYRRSKMFELRLAEKVSVRKAIEKCMDNFCSNKGSMIRSVLERLFHKVVLDHLVVDDDLNNGGVDRKCSVQSVLPDLWACQYVPLDYVRNDAFSGVMCTISMGELLSVVSSLPDGKAAGLSGVPNELWKHGGEVVLGCLLALFNKCLSVGVVPVLWKRAWPIALIETARKILSKVLSDRILMACNKFNVLRGDNFSVLKGTSTQSLVFAVSLVIEDALEKNREL
ncbi:hypothetical protein G9A89_011074, partial [Geosiphon pyriformis]